MSADAFGALARHYDALMAHVPYEKWIAGLHTLFTAWPRPVRTVLDVGCGTGTVSCGLANLGYDLVAADSSEDMLAIAREKDARPLFLQQDMTSLDLYGTIDAAACTLDCLNYLLTPGKLTDALRRVRLFLEPGGVFAFDVKTPMALCDADGHSFVSEHPDVLCVWQTQKNGMLCRHSMDLFEKQGSLWRRAHEEHSQRMYTEAQIAASLARAGFTHWKTFGHYWSRPPRADARRLFWTAW